MERMQSRRRKRETTILVVRCYLSLCFFFFASLILAFPISTRPTINTQIALAAEDTQEKFTQRGICPQLLFSQKKKTPQPTNHFPCKNRKSHPPSSPLLKPPTPLSNHHHHHHHRHLKRFTASTAPAVSSSHPPAAHTADTPANSSIRA